MRETVSGEEWNLLASSDGVHDVDSGDTSLNHFLRVDSLARVNRLTLHPIRSVNSCTEQEDYLNIKELLSQDWWTLVDWNTGSIEGSTEHFFSNWHLKSISSELAMRVEVINARGTFEDLDGLHQKRKSDR